MKRKVIKKNIMQETWSGHLTKGKQVYLAFLLCMILVVFLVNGLKNGNWIEAFLFTVAAAVLLTPELLPVIVTMNLSKGAARMSKKKTIVKDLDSIQNFGAMDVLCIDKTGTLTNNQVELEYYLDIYGNDNKRVLRHAILNSYFQTGSKTLVDEAILKCGKDPEYAGLVEKYEKTEEIPFDFNRRRMSVALRDSEGKLQLITQGAVEEIFEICTYAEVKGVVQRFTKEIQEESLKTVKKLNNGGMRVVAIAQKNILPKEEALTVRDESDMILMGYLAFLDSPKESASEAIRALGEHGVEVKVLTGDNDAVTRCICGQVGMKVENWLLGDDIDKMEDAMLAQKAEYIHVFAKLSPQQKTRIVSVLRQNGHIVGFIGNGVDDVTAMQAADIGISVENASDTAKESADVILLEKDLTVLEAGMIEGRKTFANITKYIKVTAGSNIGKIFSIVTASIFLPFLPILPVQILVLSLIYDISRILIPWDNLDNEFLKKPGKWQASSIKKAMMWNGPVSSLFDIATYGLMFFVIAPAVCGGTYGSEGVDKALFAAVFNTGWFIESLWMQALLIHMMRTSRLPFIQSRASLPVLMVTAAAVVIGTVLPYTFVGRALGMISLPRIYFVWLAGIVICYIAFIIIMRMKRETF